jgi:hypothetical protein
MNSKKSLIILYFKFAFASAVYLSTVYSDYNSNPEWKSYVWTDSLLMANAVGYLRYEAGEHFPTDILVGAITVSAIGYVISWMHRVGKENVSIAPGVPHADMVFLYR